MTLLLAVNLIDLIPNSNLTPLTYVLAGSVAGCVRAGATRRIERPVVDVSSAVAAA